MEEDLAALAARCDRTVALARAELVAAIRRAHREGLTQQEIARRVGRSQPEVHRLLRFHGMSPLGRRVARHRPDIRRAVNSIEGTNIRIFGSVARGLDDEDSDVDVLYTPGRSVSLMTIARLEEELSKIIGAPVELVADDRITPWAQEQILDEAVPL